MCAAVVVLLAPPRARARTACARAMAGRRAAVEVLEPLGLLTEEVWDWLIEEEVVTLDDLAFSYRSVEQARQEVPFLFDVWAAAAARQSEAWRGKTGIRALQLQFQKAGRAIAETVARSVKSQAQTKAATRTGKPLPKAVVKSKELDKTTRTEAAKAAVQLSLSWAPAAGVAQGLVPDDPLIPTVREVHLERLSLFEPKGV